MKSRFFIGFLFVIPLALASGCNSSKQPPTEGSLNPYNPVAQASPVKVDPVAAPNPPDIEEAVKRVFKDVATVHPDYKKTFISRATSTGTSHRISPSSSNPFPTNSPR